tara:strand:- start:2452 stop:2808 length:357 start_codon:yes stop_codon:yes gene_type:complete
MNISYFLFILYSAMSLVLCLIIFILSFALPSNNVKTTDSFSPYECGFEAFGDARNSFDVKFYLVGILFLIFDLELIFLIPWALSLQKIGFLGFISMLCFLTILTIGFIYEWKKGALDW